MHQSLVKLALTVGRQHRSHHIPVWLVYVFLSALLICTLDEHYTCGEVLLAPMNSRLLSNFQVHCSMSKKPLVGEG